ncbi:glycosyltransferase [Allobaculum sp. Allo2]|uniref:glycosyltransferase n=1 Tax=Allobaculum sp. Allo2 TaxID=2853432 RepID=UPI001F611AE3|nr:glycosyltransferase [Allobaculum sp. Allo2]UNT93031.1 glycosyltransferase [Allobaculum sp. Allo2]
MNPSNPIRLSLAMTTYNAEVYLIEQLESIRLQTMPFDEVVIVDDASRDHTVEKSANISPHTISPAAGFCTSIPRTPALSAPFVMR